VRRRAGRRARRAAASGDPQIRFRRRLRVGGCDRVAFPLDALECFLPVDGDRLGCGDADAHLAAVHAQHHQDHLVTDHEAHYSRQLDVAVLLRLLIEALWLGIAVMAFPLFFRYSRTLTLWFVALAVVVLASAVVENAAVMSMVSLSEAYARANTADRGQIEVIRAS
jgi:hypothetical protein